MYTQATFAYFQGLVSRLLFCLLGFFFKGIFLNHLENIWSFNFDLKKFRSP